MRIDRGDTYVESAALSNGVSLAGQEFEGSDTGPAVIDPGGGNALTVPGGQAAGTVQGLTLRGSFSGILAFGSIAGVTQNLFDEPDPDSGGIFLIADSTTEVSDNTFIGDGVSDEVAIQLSDGASTVSGNTITGYNGGILIGGTGGAAPTSTPTIASNTITGTHQAGSTGSGIAAFSGTDATIVGNSVSAPGAGFSIGISVNGFGEPATTGVTMRRNQVRGGHVNGIDIRDTGLAASLDSDLVSGATSQGFVFEDQGAPSPVVGDVSAVNITAWGNLQDITTNQNVLTLDSSITEDAIVDNTATCAISFSRGPTTVGGSCDTFQTTADPLFVNAGAGDFHLQASSPMIDMGDPAAPAAGSLDLDGDPRALDATPACAGNVDRRDIGADEFVAAPATGCDPQQTPQLMPTLTPPKNDPPAKKKCKKKPKKGKKGAAAAKKKAKKCKKKGKKK